MIQAVHIKNFKSVYDLNIELGRFNIFIGENGCGKSNILEAIAFGAAASANKLDYEFLGSRGLRLTSPEFMRSAFQGIEEKNSIDVNFKIDGDQYTFELTNINLQWLDLKRESFVNTSNLWLKIVLEKDEAKKKELIDNIAEKDKEGGRDFIKAVEILSNLYKKEDLQTVIPQLSERLKGNETLSNFIIYKPEETSLRKFQETNQIYPLGIHGEGLFQYLKEMLSNTENAVFFDEINQNLSLLDWYDDFKLPQNLMSNEFSLHIKDKYLNQNLHYFDQRSTNEGFLFLLFYTTLFCSKITPPIFAIDNIDTSFNPKMCMQLVKTLVLLSEKHNKQALVTTHNPAILDGLNLADDNQRLFVVSRNEEGHTRVRRIEHKEDRKLKLSEIWTSGFIGGLPDNF